MKYFSLEFIERIVSRIESQIKKVKFKTIMQRFSQAYMVNIVTNIHAQFLLKKQHHYQVLAKTSSSLGFVFFLVFFGYNLGCFMNQYHVFIGYHVKKDSYFPQQLLCHELNTTAMLKNLQSIAVCNQKLEQALPEHLSRKCCHRLRNMK